MPYGADYGRAASRDGARHHLFVEGPQVLHAAAAAPHDDDLRVPKPVQQADGRRDFSRGPLALHPDRAEVERHARIAPPAHAGNIMHHGARPAGHDAHAARKQGQGFFQRRIKQAFSGQLLLERLKAQVQFAQAVGFHGVSVKLIRSGTGVQAHTAKQPNALPVFRAEAHPHGCLTKHGAVDRRLLVLEGKVPVAGGMALEIAQLARQAQAVKHGVGRQRAAHVFVELRYGERQPFHSAAAAFSAAATVLSISMAMVILPTPPGTGVI